MIFRQLLDPATSTFTYLLADSSTRQGVLIDPVFEQHFRDLALLRELEVDLLWSVETHIHADHVTGAWLLQRELGSRIAVAAAAGAQGADLPLVTGQRLDVGDLRFEVRATPGHTDGCVSLALPHSRRVFTGDALLIRGAGRTDFQQGDASQLYHSVRDQLFTLPDDTIVYPGHDYSGRCSSTIGEEKRFNPRLGLPVREQDFVRYMENLGLQHPRRLDIAVPANLKCGRPENPTDAPCPPSWGPVIRTFAGVWQVDAEWVFAHRDELNLIDVREEDELGSGSVGRLPDAELRPLSRLRDETATLPTDKPIVFICPAGARSAIAATITEKALSKSEGEVRVASLQGGLMGWKSLGLPVADDRDSLVPGS